VSTFEFRKQIHLKYKDCCNGCEFLCNNTVSHCTQLGHQLTDFIFNEPGVFKIARPSDCPLTEVKEDDQHRQVTVDETGKVAFEKQDSALLVNGIENWINQLVVVDGVAIEPGFLYMVDSVTGAKFLIKNIREGGGMVDTPSVGARK